MIENAELIDGHFRRNIDAMQLLHKNGFMEAALSLWYTTIDQLAWLSIDSDDSNGDNFKAWVSSYLLPRNRLGCSDDDLWGARNGWLHTGTAESRLYRKGVAKKIHYFSIDEPEDKATNVIYLNITEMMVALLEAFLFFIEDIKQNEEQLKIANTKVNKRLLWVRN